MLHTIGGVRLIGPLCFYDLARLAQRGRTTQLRCAYAIVLVVFLAVVVHNRFPDLLSNPFRENPALSLSMQASFARTYVLTVFVLQAIAVLVLTPAYLASSFAEEKEQKTLELLFVTELYDRELVLGKLVSRLIHLAMVLLTGLPVLSLAMLWGGVRAELLVVGFAVTILTMLSVGSLSLLCSIISRTMLGAVVSSYAVVGFLNLLCLMTPALSPILFLVDSENQVETAWAHYRDEISSSFLISGPPLGGGNPFAIPPPRPTAIRFRMLALFAFFHGAIFLVATGASIRTLRQTCLMPGELFVGPIPNGGETPAKLQHRKIQLHAVQEPVEAEDFPILKLRKVELELKEVSARVETLSSWGPDNDAVSPIALQPPARSHNYSSVRDPALLWKEMKFGEGAISGLSPRELLAYSAHIGICLTALSCGSLCLLWRDPVQWPMVLSGFAKLIGFVTAVLTGIWSLLLAFRVASCISKERDQQTLEGLFTLPVDREEILYAKWLGSILRYRVIGYSLVAIWLLGLAVGALHPWSALLLASTCGVYLALLASLGVGLSLVSRTTLWANMSMALVVLSVLCSTLLSFTYETVPHAAADWQQNVTRLLLNPVYTLWFAAFSWSDLTQAISQGDRQFLHAFGAAPMVPLLFGVLALVAWVLAVRRFRKEVERRKS